jgi:hypothetical protein
MKPGEFYKVKRTPVTRYCGVRTWGGAKGDENAWPGEVGEVVKREWTAWDGSAMSGLWIEFSRGRSKCIDSLSDDDRAEFLRVKAPAKEAA